MDEARNLLHILNGVSVLELWNINWKL